MTEPRTVAATDGSAIGNPGPSGWAWITEDGRQDWASHLDSTNNRMELMAVKELLRATGSEPLLIQSDSQYVVKTFTVWKASRLAGKKSFKNSGWSTRYFDFSKAAMSNGSGFAATRVTR